MTGEPLLETERLVLTGWRPEQLPDLVRLHGDPETARYLSADGLPWTAAQCAERLALWIGMFRTQRLGKLRVSLKISGVLVGRAGFGLHPPNGEPEIGYALFPEHRGQGYAREAAAGLRDWIFRETAHRHFIGFADIRNLPSLRILRGIGMEPTHVEDHQGMACQFHILRRSA